MAGRNKRQGVEARKELQEHKTQLQDVGRGHDERDISSSEKTADPTETKKKLKISLAGFKETKEWVDGEGYVTKIEEDKSKRSICNEECINDLWPVIEGIVTEETAGSNLDGKDIEQEGYQTMQAVVNKLFANHDRYGIDTPADAEIIRVTFHDLIKNTLKKAEGARYLEHLEQSVRKNILERVGDGGQSSGGGGVLSGLFRGD